MLKPRAMSPKWDGALYGQFCKSVRFLPSVEPEFMQVQVHARGNFSICERNDFVRRVEQRRRSYHEITSIHVRSTMTTRQGDKETLGPLQLELIDWDERRPVEQIGENAFAQNRESSCRGRRK